MIKLLLIILFPMIVGCGGYYTSQIEFYRAQSNSNIAYLQTINNRKPIAEMVAPDGTVFRVNNSDNITQPIIIQAANPIVDSIKTIVNSTPVNILSGGWSAKEIIKQSSGNTTTTNTGNTDITGNVDQSTTDNSAVATPTVIQQPQPIVVKPEVVISKEITTTSTTSTTTGGE